MASLALYLFGSPGVEYQGDPVHFNTRKAVALLAYLAITATPHTREALTTLLWPELDHRRGRAALRSTLSVAKKGLCGKWLCIEGGTISLPSQDDFWFDVARFRSLLQECRTHGHAPHEPCARCLPLLSEAAALYRDDFMAGFSLGDSAAFDEWQFFQSETLRREMSQALAQLVQWHAAQQSFEMAVDYARRRLALDPLHEEVHRQLMRLYAAAGRRGAALRQYQQCARILAEELDTVPAAETTALYERFRDGEGENATQKSSLARHANLFPATPFIGRTVELAQIKERLAGDRCRLLALVGGGGMGKTRLAWEAAQAVADLFAQGAAFVPLASVSSADFLVAAVAGALEFSFYGRETPQRQLLSYLHEKEMLLVLDNFEHLLEGTGLLVEILQHAPGVKLLVTSRERLNLRGEWVMEVAGLPFPINNSDLSLEEHEAVQLFVESARRVTLGFSIAGSEEAVAGICRLLAGMPLGLELAAAWTRVLSCAQIARKIARNLDFLTSTLRDVPPRHRSLRAVFDHSWALLTAAEQQAFCRLSIFGGGFDRQAATAVAGVSLPVLSSLVDKSFLRRHPLQRYTIPEALRHYGAEKRQSSGENEAIRTVHSHYFADFLARQEARLKGEHQREALAAIGVEIENVRLAWHWAIEQKDRAAAGKALESLFLFYEIRNLFQEGEAAFREIGEWALPDGEHDGGLIVARGLARQGRFCHRLGRYRVAEERLRKSLVLARELHATADIAFALNNLGYVAWSRSAYEQAEALYRESLALYRQSGDLWGTGRVLNNLAILPQERAQTRALLQESLELSQQIGDLWGQARTLNNLGTMMDETAVARQRCRESAAICRQIGDRFLTVFPLINLGHVARREGHFAEAQQFYRESLLICREIGYRSGAARCLGHLGTAAYALGDYEKAQRHCRQGLAICQEVGDQRGCGLLLHSLGMIAAAEGNRAEARTCYQASRTIFQEVEDHQGVAWPLLGLARLAHSGGDHQRVQQLAQESLTIFKEVADKDGLVRAYALLGYVAVGIGRGAEAQRMFTEALAVRPLVLPATLDVLVGIATLRMAQGDGRQALFLLRFVLAQTTVEQETRDRATSLWSAWAAELGEELVTAVGSSPLPGNLEDVLENVWPAP